jgi:hypothetical protein
MVYRKQTGNEAKREVGDGDICEDSDVVALLDCGAVIFDVCNC